MKNMPNTSIILALLLLTTFPAVSLCGWQMQPFVFGERLYKIGFANSQVGWITGEKGIYKTSDGGVHWMKQDTTLGYSEALCVLNENTVFCADCSITDAMKTRGIRKTTDGGQTWVTVDTAQFFYADFEFVTPQIGYAACGRPNWAPIVRKTIDGGDHWETLPAGFKPSKYEAQGISFVDESHGWALTYDGYVFTTADGGQTWALQDSVRGQFNDTVPMRDIQFITPDSGWAVGGISGQMIIARTINGGKTWSNPEAGGSSLQEVQFLSSKVGWVAGTSNAQPFLAQTVDGGEKWTVLSQSISNISGVASISMVSERVGYAIGRIRSDEYRLLKTDDAVGVAYAEEPGVVTNGCHLNQNYPNPFNAVSVISFDLPASASVTLSLYNIRGEQVQTIANGIFPAGRHQVNLEAGGLSCGIYFYRMTAGAFSSVKKLVLQN